MATTPDPAAPGMALTPGRWTVDPHHSVVSFAIRHLGLSRVRGRFDRFTATLDLGAGVADARVAATIDLASVNTGDPGRDAFLRSAEAFSVEQHPTLTFTSTAISGAGTTWALTGDVTLHGHTHPITFAVEFHGAEVFPLDGTRHLGFSATGVLRRSVFGLAFGLVPLSGGDRLLLGDEVGLEIEAQFVEPAGPA